MNRKNKIRVALGMSGGVDSSVAALLLRQEGYEVIGLTMLIWDDAITLDSVKGNACYGPDEKEDLASVRQTAELLDIPHYAVDLQKEYRHSVLDWYRDRYLAGTTPNPCAVCNPVMKFGGLVEKAKKMGLQFDYFATGHYARRIPPSPGHDTYRLFKGADSNKDQSYFLARLNQRQLANSLFPLGDKTKTEIRRLANELGLEKVAEQAESQDFFAGDDPGILFPRNKVRPGPIIDLEGRRIGTHRGIVYYTIGQREGLGVAAGRKVYVKEIDAENNTIVLADRDQVMSAGCRVVDVKWISGKPPEKEHLTVRLRYRHQGIPSSMRQEREGKWLVRFQEPQFAVTAGQLAAFYDKDELLGGGWIDKPSDDVNNSLP